MRADGDRSTAAAPMPGQLETDVLADHVDHGGFQPVGVDVLYVDPAQRLRRGDLGGMARSNDYMVSRSSKRHSSSVFPLCCAIRRNMR